MGVPGCIICDICGFLCGRVDHIQNYGLKNEAMEFSM